MEEQKSSHLWSRRTILELGALNTMMMLSCRRPPVSGVPVETTDSKGAKELSSIDFGPLQSGTTDFLDLPSGFSAVVLQRADEVMSCGNRVPAQPDGMTCHVDADGNYVLLRNHELGVAWLHHMHNNIIKVNQDPLSGILTFHTKGTNALLTGLFNNLV